MALVPELISLMGSFILSDMALLLWGPGSYLGVAVCGRVSHSTALCYIVWVCREVSMR